MIPPIGLGGKPLGLGVRRAAKALDEDQKGTSITGTLSGDQENADRQRACAPLGEITTSWLAESPPGSCRASPPA
jgi:hypothetical protein